jgi:HrpA-like RNA helicase
MAINAPERASTQKESVPPPPIEQAIESTMSKLSTWNLPIFKKNEEITQLMRAHDQVIIEGETGSGKSTVVPILALQLAQEQNPNRLARVAVTEPRKITTQGSYKTFYPTMRERVGYRHGDSNRTSNESQLEFIVERSLLNTIVKKGDPLLMHYDTVVIDEVHEGTVDSHILLGLLKQIQKKREGTDHPLKIVVTSATLDREKLINYLNSSADPEKPSVGHISVEGKMHPVEEHFSDSSIDERDMPAAAARKAIEIYEKGEEAGDMLVFMPGAAEINKTIDALRKLQQEKGISDDEIEFISLRSGEDSAESMEKALSDSPKRRIFVATNLAETGVTIKSAKVVIDSGLMRGNEYDAETGLEGLRTSKATKSNLRQRKGRVGRVSPGHVHYLFTKADYDSRHDHREAEILRTDLSRQVLLMKALGIEDIEGFDFIDHPGAHKIKLAINSLRNLGALDDSGNLTEIGQQMTEIDTDPRFARMLIEARKLGIEEDVALVIGMISNARLDITAKGYQINDAIFEKYVDPSSDIATRLRIWNEYIKNNGSEVERKAWESRTKFKTYGFYQAATVRNELLRNKKLKDSEVSLSDENLGKINACLLAGFSDNIVYKENGIYRTVSGATGVKFDTHSVLGRRQPEAFVSGNIRRTTKGEVIAGFNFEVYKSDIADIIAKKKTTATPESLGTATTESEKKIEELKQEVQQLEKEGAQVHSEELKQTATQQTLHSEATSSNHGNEEKKNGIREKVKELYRKFQDFLRKLRILEPQKSGSGGH